MKNTRPSTKTILVLGASYGGSRTAQVLAAGLKDINARAPTKEQQWRVVLVDRNHHANHLYIFSRISVLPGHEHKAFIPYTNVFALHPPHPEGGTTFPPSLPHSFIHAKVNNIDLHANEVRLQHLSDDGERKKDEEETIAYDYLVYAMGSHLPAPIDMWGERIYKDSAAPSKELPSRNVDLEEPVALAEEEYRGLKPQAVARMRADQKRIAAAQSVLVVGGGALGIQYATDISAVHPATKVTLLHSRTRLLPKFDKMMHTEILQTLKDAGVKTILGERLSMKSLNHPRYNEKGEKVLITENGREICADLVLLCTGQRPNTRLLAESDSTTVDPNTGMTRVARTMQVTGSRPRARRGSGPTLSSSPEVEEETAAVALNRLSSITLDRHTSILAESGPQIDAEADEAMVYEHVFAIGDAADAFGAIQAGHNAYYQGEVAARNILKLVKKREDLELEHYTPGPPAIKVSLGITKSVYQINGVVGVKDDGTEDLDAAGVWAYFGIKGVKEERMYD
ncbi:FAD/NAD(P)-binding domain-containing protein [Punctularia strigosozonata HHB-11173 SS5]|uniref:FAD/NAD(P)-binding domain-containing protein n=1 Tax=Punctularia strigosozonata (strain HHB-11173) TaxID=741275 RepID=UPI0004418297|nr:FAD/NAD(P)-binding domain-containing protein [Punctularia strigosozonata HHB-11173 SS5]EIN06508.1 FAD/NAD(P)-binding domain-containing protein [Punctularia strigosozonata HHB-11173 SS5]